MITKEDIKRKYKEFRNKPLCRWEDGSKRWWSGDYVDLKNKPSDSFLGCGTLYDDEDKKGQEMKLILFQSSSNIPFITITRNDIQEPRLPTPKELKAYTNRFGI